MRLGQVAVLALVIGAGAACSDTPTSTSTSKATQISVGPGTYFSPNSVTISAGDTVIWVWGGGGHDVTFTSAGAPASCPNMGAGVCIRVFPTAGTFHYLCQPHAGLGMVGVVNVQ